MNVPPSDRFTPLNLAAAYNARREQLAEPLCAPDSKRYGFGPQAYLGIPFELGQAGANNVILIDHAPIAIELDGAQAAYLVFLHVAENRTGPDLADNEFGSRHGNEMGRPVSDYVLEFVDDTSVVTPIVRRIGIQQSTIGWGASPFAAVPARTTQVFPTLSESHQLGRVGYGSWGVGVQRTTSGRDNFNTSSYVDECLLWLHALANPEPDKQIRRLVLVPREEASAVYAISITQVRDHPLRPSLRQKFHLRMPPNFAVNAIDEVEGVGLDLGTMISARRALRYDRAQWEDTAPEAQPAVDPDFILVECAPHPQAKLYVADDVQADVVYDLAQPHTNIVQIAAANRPVRLSVVEKGLTRPVPVRLHLHGEAGEYLPPRGHHRKVNSYWIEDLFAEFVNGRNQYSYVRGECVADLPLGEVFVEILRGYEVKPIRTSVRITPDTDEITFELERPLHWRETGWVTADTHVHFLSPQTALLEGAAEGVNVVNLLASQWGEMFSNVGDFDGRTTFGAKDFGGDGEFMVRVGTENRMQVLGHISLLGYHGPMIHPLCTGGPSESAVGDALEVTMADWARQCIEQNGLVVLPHAPNPQAERAADIVLGLVHAIETMTFSPFDWQITPEALADWYRYLNLGYQLPLVGGSDKMSAASLLGGVRTYAHLGDRPFTYEDWKQAIRAGNTFTTVGPLVQILVEGRPPGSTVRLPASGGTVSVAWTVESARCPAEALEIVVGGRVVEVISLQPGSDAVLKASGSVELKVDDSTWIAARVRGSYRARPGDIAAHTSAVVVLVADKPLWSETDGRAVLTQIGGTLTYVDTLAPRGQPQELAKLRATLAAAHELMHQRIHANHLHS